MFKPTRTGKLLLHVANLTVIFFILLPLAAVFIGSIQSEKALQADTRRLLPGTRTDAATRALLYQWYQAGYIDIELSQPTR